MPSPLFCSACCSWPISRCTISGSSGSPAALASFAGSSSELPARKSRSISRKSSSDGSSHGSPSGPSAPPEPFRESSAMRSTLALARTADRRIRLGWPRLRCARSEHLKDAVSLFPDDDEYVRSEPSSRRRGATRIVDRMAAHHGRDRRQRRARPPSRPVRDRAARPGVRHPRRRRDRRQVEQPVIEISGAADLSDRRASSTC